MPVVILNVQDAPAYDKDGRLVRFRIVTYKVDELGPFGLSGLAEDLTEEEIRRQIRAEAAELRRLMGGIE